jgi:hypothetical protein
MTVSFGSRILKKGDTLPEVEELQIRLAGFEGTIPDGSFGAGTETQVKMFQRDFMGMNAPSGIVDRATFEAINNFAEKFPLDFKELRCPCGLCGGFGRGLNRSPTHDTGPREEKSYNFEYPGIHRMILWSVRAAFFYLRKNGFQGKLFISSGYRCEKDNQIKNRTSTNHHGKAVDFDLHDPNDLGSQADKRRCNEARDMLVATAAAQIGWARANRKALEPSEIAPTWVHYDIRCYAPAFLQDRFFCTSLKDMDQLQPVSVA